MTTYNFQPLNNPKSKYIDPKDFAPKMETRTWPTRRIIDIEVPKWCSVDLRDGNQALKNPMTLEQKLKFWEMLVALGFKEIEIGFPAASKVEYDFTRALIERDLIPDDVTVQVLSQSRKEQIEKTIECLKGAKNAVVHLYNSTSDLQMSVVFNKNEDEIIKIIIDGINELSKLKETTSTNITLEYSPESFTGTRPDFALRICNAVIAAWMPSRDNKMIINLPATVEMTSPNVYADQVEYFSKNVRNRDSVILSIHPHNDMGTAVGAAELALLAGADRVEGTLFGNGERTGNLDLLVLGLDLYAQGVNPNLNFSNIDAIRNVYEECTGMKVHERHPYAGDAVFTAYSGSHQDAIRKGFNAMKTANSDMWEVPYILIDPNDIGRKYEPIVINSQSGKGGVAYIVEHSLGFFIPKEMQADFAKVVQAYCDKLNSSNPNEQIVSPQEMKKLFYETYFKEKHCFNLSSFELKSLDENIAISFSFKYNGQTFDVKGKGENEVIALKNALETTLEFPYHIEIIDNHRMSNENREFKIASYAKITNTGTNEVSYGVGTDINERRANINAIFSALNRINVDSQNEINNLDAA